MGLARNWTKAEEEYLMDSWGTRSIPGIARHLNRSVNAIKIRAQRLHLGPVLMGGDYVSLCALMKAFGMYGTYAYKRISWVEKRGFPVHSKLVNEHRFKVVYIDEFWAWAEQHRSFLDFSRIPKGILGVEPAWVKDQRRKDKEAVALQRKDRWTPEEDELLRELLENGCGWLEASERMHRSCGAIQHRLKSQGLVLRPDRKGSHETKWTNVDREIMAEGVRTGESYMMIGKRMNRSEKAVR